MNPKALLTGALVIVCALSVTRVAATTPPTADQNTEQSAAGWVGEAQYATAAVYDDTSRVQEGAYSIRFETDGGFDTWLYYPATQDADWNLLAANSGGVSFWVYAENNNPGFQNYSPFVRLYTDEFNYFELTPDYDVLNDARNQWQHYTVPINGDGLWNADTFGAPDLAHINYIEFHADTWDAGFVLWFDGISFDVSLAAPQGLSATAGDGEVTLTWDPFNDPAGMFDHYAIYRGLAPFTDVSAMTPIATRPGINDTDYVDNAVTNGVGYYYAVTAVFTNGGETTTVESIGPRVPRDEMDLQITCISRTPRYPRYAPQYTYYQVTEPSGFGPYVFSAATGLGGGQDENTQRWPNVGDPVTYTAHVRNRGTAAFDGTLEGTWRVDGDVVSTPAQVVTLAAGDVTTFTYVRNWDDQWHEITFTLDTVDDRSENNERTIYTKSAPFLTYVDESFIEAFRDTYSPNYPLAATDDMVDWLQRHADEMNAMFAAAGSLKRVHYDVLEVLHDEDPDPTLDTIYFGVFPFRYRASQIADPRSPGYYHADVDIDYGLCHEMSHQLGLIDLYQIDLPGELNEVSGTGYSATAGMMHSCAPYYSAHSAGAMTDWASIVHGYYGQYLYDLPDEVKLRIVDDHGTPLDGVTITVYQKVERPGFGGVITSQVKAQGTTDAAGEWTLPNVPIDQGMVPPTAYGQGLKDNPFGYVAVVGTNGLLHFKIEYDEFVEYAWLEISDVNLAYWAGQTETAVFEYELAVGGGVQNFPPADLAELNAADWSAWAQDGEIAVFDDASWYVAGDGSLRAEATGGFDNYVRYPSGIIAHWDLSNVTQIHFWAYAENPNFSFQNLSPWIRLGNFEDGWFEWKPTSDVLNQAMGQWREFTVPIAGGSGWTRTANGTPDLSQINYFQLNADTWGAGFTLWLDDVRFEPSPRPDIGDMNCDGTVNLFDIDPFVVALASQPTFEQYHGLWPNCDPLLADANEDGVVDLFDIDPFVILLGGG